MTLEQRYLDVCHAVGEYLLKAMRDLSSAAGVDYMLYAGTLLGSARHEGWIPWDDDIDVLMFRHDYEALRRSAAAHLPDDVVVSDLEIDPEHVTVIPRLLHTGTTRLPSDLARTSQAPDTVYLALDVFILDRAPDSALRRGLWRLRIRAMEKLVTARSRDARTVVRRPGHVAKKAVELLGVGLSRSASSATWRGRYLRSVTRYADRPDLASRFAITNGIGSERKLLFTADELLPTRPTRFEGLDVMGPQDAVNMLRSLYGPAFMTPPPLEQRRPVHIRNGVTSRLEGVLVEVRAGEVESGEA